MTSRTTSLRRAPGPVLAAAILVGAIGVLGAIALGAFGALSGSAAGIVAGVAFAVAGGLVAVGLWRGYRGAQIAAVVFAAVGVLSGLSALGNGNAGGVVQIALSATVAGLVLIPVSSREWFSRR
jgi:hypothetical protein